MPKKQFSIYLNDTKLLFTIPATKRDAVAFIKRYLTSTHMGGWRKVPGGYEYATTIGKYYRFVRDEVRHA